ncbi:aldehyde dehydrogenase (acceptor) [Alkalispirochaeta americana]|uniref:Betaine-aldehyde dehydrogenase n=1 Tax=Alkalispirochaeta americana TaxID=159291 RepID=A0A1N6VB91_9SPIO|nr:betaine-aldehyde dehydrogenase [Alkalispirochaeta americana]SIQ75170.1 aldehyde dehydrogenase (acceptor) [Alkalispirochaeta americana]
MEQYLNPDTLGKMYIDGEWREAASGKTRDIIYPYDQRKIARVTEGDVEDARQAIAAARRAFDKGDWARTPASERGALVGKLADLIERDAEELAALESWDTAKTMEESRGDMQDIAGIFRYFAGLADKDAGEVIASPIPNTTSTIVREPVGVCGQISPWNYPLLQASWKMAPALATGNTIVMKPSEDTPLTTIKVTQLAEEAGFPAGVVNLVLGAGPTVGKELAESVDVDLISFTGGIETGRKIMQAATGNMKKIAFELGGKNPNVIFADTDLELAIDYVLNGIFFHAGQVCSAGARLIVEDSLHDKLVEGVIERTKKIRLGEAFDPKTEMGPLISEKHRAKVERYIQIGKDEGAKLVLGGDRPSDPALQKGFFVNPTIFVDCDTSMRIVQEEVFGPVLTVERFHTEEEAIRLANDTTYGLSGAVWSKDQNRAHRVASAMRMGTVWINDFNIYFAQAPWGGYKQSGIGRELGAAGLEEYTEIKHVYQNYATEPLNWFGASS